LFGTPDDSVALQNMFAETGSRFPKNCHVVPESQLSQANAFATQVVAQFFNLCAFACAINSGKCDQYRFQISFLGKRTVENSFSMAGAVWYMPWTRGR